MCVCVWFFCVYVYLPAILFILTRFNDNYIKLTDLELTTFTRPWTAFEIKVNVLPIEVACNEINSSK